MKFASILTLPSKLNPAHDRPSQRSVFGFLRSVENLFASLFGGAGLARRQISSGRQSATLEYGLNPAISGVTVAAPANAATITLNGTAITAAEHRANCTVTFASVANNDSLTVNGLVITAKTSPSGAYEFARGGTDAADALAFVTCFNALYAATNSAGAVAVAGLIKADRPAADGVVNLFAVTEGTAGNAYTIVTSSGSTLAITNDSSGLFAGGLAATNNQWDMIGDNATIARSIVTNLGLSSTAILNKHVKGACRKGIVTAATVLYADTVTLDSVVLRAIKETTDSGGARVTTFPDDVFGIGASDTATGDCLVNCIHNHPKLRERFYATNSSGAVTIRERPPEATNPPPLVTSNGSRLAVTATSNGCLADSALVLIQSQTPGHSGNAITIASSSGGTLAVDGSASRLSGGTSTVLAL